MSSFSPSQAHRRISPDRTRELRSTNATPDTTDFELSGSVANPVSKRIGLISGSQTSPRKQLDDTTCLQFHQRLRLCCLIAVVPLTFFLVCSFTNFIELFGRTTVGVVGSVLCSIVVCVLCSIGIIMFRRGPLSEGWLRVLEVVVFGQLALFFAYWQFTVQTGSPEQFYDSVNRMEMKRDEARREFVGPPRGEPVKVPNPAVEVPPNPPPQVFPPVADPTREPSKAAERLDAVRELTHLHERSQVLAATLISHFNWLLLIVFHAVLVPSTLGRGLGVTLALAILPLGIDTVVAATHTPAQESLVPLFAVAITMLLAGSGLAVFGTAKTAELQRQVQSAREAVREMGQYRLQRKLGSGGMGEVYLAEHRLLKRQCALKRIHARYLNNPEQVKRFQREVRATSQLRHPNTVEIYDYGISADGTFYYVMEYLPGLSLEELVGQFGPLPSTRVIHLMRQVCGALREAHGCGLVHRDIKPSNIVVFPAGSPHDQVKLVDFGLVHSLAEVDQQPDAKITRDGLIVGTPEYMSPEQASGGILDGRSDLFSLGSVAFYLLTGREAFHRENPMKTLLAVVSDNPAPISEFNQAVPADLTAVLAKVLQKDPEQRFQTAADLEHALAECRSVGEWTEQLSNDWWQKNPTARPMTSTDLEIPILPAR
jgi:tRNA A-37 threonylcarbamoyl transferase component Bud32